MQKLLLMFLLLINVTWVYGTPAEEYFTALGGWQEESSRKYADLGDLLIFVSFSIPAMSLQQLIMDAHKVGGHLVIRGLVNNSFKDTAQALYELIHESKSGGIMLDPTLFQKFNIKQVPAFVVVNHDNLRQPLCSKFDIVYGNVSLSYVLHKIASGGDEGKVAQRMLHLLDRYR